MTKCLHEKNRCQGRATGPEKQGECLSTLTFAFEVAGGVAISRQKYSTWVWSRLIPSQMSLQNVLFEIVTSPAAKSLLERENILSTVSSTVSAWRKLNPLRHARRTRTENCPLSPRSLKPISFAILRKNKNFARSPIWSTKNLVHLFWVPHYRWALTRLAFTWLSESIAVPWRSLSSPLAACCWERSLGERIL